MEIKWSVKTPEHGKFKEPSEHAKCIKNGKHVYFADVTQEQLDYLTNDKHFRIAKERKAMDCGMIFLDKPLQGRRQEIVSCVYAYRYDLENRLGATAVPQAGRERAPGVVNEFITSAP